MPKVKMVPIATMFTFDTLLKDATKRVEFFRKLYGYTEYSYFSKYKYKRTGLLSEIPYLKPTESTIIVKQGDAAAIRVFFLKSKAEFTEHLVILSSDEAKTLGITHPNRWHRLVEDLKGSPNLLVTVDF